jgi:cytidylate kinase
MRISVAIDGPAGAGKSTIAKLVSKEFDLMYINTGAMYRAVALIAEENDIEPTDIERLIDLIDTLEMHFENDDLILNGVNVQDKITMPEISSIVSNYASIPEVREKLVNLQRKMGEIGNVVLDGRDIGTNVFPNADVKIFLTAPVKARALRRFLENKEKGINISYDELVADLERRDLADSTRAIAPLKQAEDAVYLDNSNLNVEETADKIIEIIKEKTGGK